MTSDFDAAWKDRVGDSLEVEVRVLGPWTDHFRPVIHVRTATDQGWFLFHDRFYDNNVRCRHVRIITGSPENILVDHAFKSQPDVVEWCRKVKHQKLDTRTSYNVIFRAGLATETPCEPVDGPVQFERMKLVQITKFESWDVHWSHLVDGPYLTGGPQELELEWTKTSLPSGGIATLLQEFKKLLSKNLKTAENKE